MKHRSFFMSLTHLIMQDKKSLCTLISYASVMVIFINLETIKSPIVGLVSSAFFFLINSIFMGQAFFQNENLFTKFLLGNLLLIVTLGVVGLTVMILYNLDNMRTTIALLVATTAASILNRRLRINNATR